MVSERNQILTLVLSAFVLLIVIVLSITLGAIPISLSDFFHYVYLSIGAGSEFAKEQYSTIHAIVFQIRLPRVLAAVMAGGALAVAGVCTQGLFRNPLATPDILGVSAGSSFGAVLAISLGYSLVNPFVIPLAACVGALLSALFVYYLARKSQSEQSLYLILAGLALSSLLGGMTMGILLFAKQYEINQFVFWTMGGLEGRMWQHILWPFPVIFGVLIAIFFRFNWLNLLALGDEGAHGLGLNVAHAKFMLLLFATLLTALSISIAGPIGFIGLMVPHLVRLLFGANHKSLLPISALWGAILLLVSDLAGRYLIAPYEIKAGVIISVIGGLYFVALIVRVQQKGERL